MLWLIVGTLLLSVAQVTGSFVLLLAGLAVAALAWVHFKPGVLRMLRTGQTIADSGKGAFTLSAFDGAYWLAHMSEEWVARYGSTWVFGQGRDRVWWYVPKGGRHGVE